MTIQAIPTTYAGVRFRSRLEARWAVVFDHLEIRWEYEPQGYTVNGVAYLPDFYLPNSKTWVEVKGHAAAMDWGKVAAACDYTDSLPGLQDSDGTEGGRGLLLLSNVPNVTDVEPSFCLLRHHEGVWATSARLAPGIGAEWVSTKVGTSRTYYLDGATPSEHQDPVSVGFLSVWLDEGRTFPARQATRQMLDAYSAGRSARFDGRSAPAVRQTPAVRPAPKPKPIPWWIGLAPGDEIVAGEGRSYCVLTKPEGEYGEAALWWHEQGKQIRVLMRYVAGRRSSIRIPSGVKHGAVVRHPERGLGTVFGNETATGGPLTYWHDSGTVKRLSKVDESQVEVLDQPGPVMPHNPEKPPYRWDPEPGDFVKRGDSIGVVRGVHHQPSTTTWSKTYVSVVFLEDPDSRVRRINANRLGLVTK